MQTLKGGGKGKKTSEEGFVSLSSSQLASVANPGSI